MSSEDNQVAVVDPGDTFGRKALPIYNFRFDFLAQFQSYDTLILGGETGSGKTTQIPQFILESNPEELIAITQPRRVAAISVARRVAEEMNSTLGEIVGYSIRFEDVTSKDTKIKYLTDGLLLREAMWNPTLDKYATIILDEAHERTIHTDVLFGVVKNAQKKRKNANKLKIIIMSATLNLDKFGNYFPNSKIVNVQGRQHPINFMYFKNDVEDYCFDTLQNIVKLHKELDVDHHILAFFTGQEEIEAGVSYLKHACKAVFHQIFPLYSALPSELQTRALAPPVLGTRRIILATNIAETSITIPGIKVVVDCGHVKMRFHDSLNGLERLQTMRISQAQAMQRAGRAGRIGPGVCYRVYSVGQYDKMEKESTPEILRVSPSGVILQLLKMGINRPLAFEWIDSPPAEDISRAIEELVDMEAIKRRGEVLQICSLGQTMVNFPLDPRMAKALIIACTLKVSESVIAIIALLTADLIFNPRAEDLTIQARRCHFNAGEGDLLALYYMLVSFLMFRHKEEHSDRTFCNNYGLNYKSFETARQIKIQLVKLAKKNQVYCEGCVSEMRSYNIRKSFFKAMPNNVAIHQKGNTYKIKRPGKAEVVAKIHRESMFINDKPKVIHFLELGSSSSSTSKENYMKYVSSIGGDWLTETEEDP